MVGAAEASGLLTWIGEFVVHLSFGSILVRCLLLMWLAGIVTAFLNAGPTTALFLPLVMGFTAAAPHYLDWWSLSLGVLAGSSATLTGATAGSVASNMSKEFRADKEYELSFRNYARVGMPLAIIFLVVSSIYIVLLYSYI